MRNLSQAHIAGKKIIVRVDYNVPITNGGKIADSSRIEATLPTLRFLILKKAKTIYLLTHWGRPKKEEERWRTRPLAEALLKILKKNKIQGDFSKIKEVSLGATSPVLKRAYQISENLVLLENVRFDSREQENSEPFARELAKLAEIYVNDSFATAHRAHTSVVALAHQLPAYPGLLFKKEIENLTALLRSPRRPFVAVIGGAKLEDKLPAAQALSKIADQVIVGGKVGLQFLKQKISTSAVLPVDGVTEVGKIVSLSPAVLEKEQIFDLGPVTIQLFKAHLKDAQTVFWNGCLGKVEDRKFVHGTYEIARFIANLRAQKVVSGGDTIAVISRLNLKEEFDFVSTGGGATLKFLAGEELPGLKALTEKTSK